MSSDSHREFDDDITEDYHDCDADLEGDDGSMISMSNAQRAYLESNNSKKQLFLMCFGLTDEGGIPVFDLDTEPWNAIKKRDIKPARVEYASEIIRRSNSMSTAANQAPHQLNNKPANWSLAKCVQWLQVHPVVDQEEISFLKNEVRRVKEIVLNAQQERRDEEARQAGGQWRGPVPYLRLMLCLTEDAIKAAFLRRADARSRLELDARNSAVRPPTAFELIANKWNDKDYNPVTAVSDCHEDFAAPIDCAHNRVAMLVPAVPQKVEDSLASIRSNLLRIIADWERSGQGEGGRHAGSDDEGDGEESHDDPTNRVIFDTTSVRFGSLSRTSRSECALQSRAAFLRGKPSYLLYFWELADRHQLLQSALQRLNDDVGALDASSVPSATSSATSNNGSAGENPRPRRRRRQDEEQQPSPQGDIFDLSQSIRFVAKADDDRQVRRRVAELQDQARNFRRMFAESDDPNSARARFYQDEVEQIAYEIASLQESLIATPISRNATPRTPRTP
jgi:hypothetical protein